MVKNGKSKREKKKHGFVIGWFSTREVSGTPNLIHFHIPIRYPFFLLTSRRPWPHLNAGCWKHVWGVWFKILSQDGEQIEQ